MSLSFDQVPILDEEDIKQAWRQEWMASVDEEDQPQLLQWEARRLSEPISTSNQLPSEEKCASSSDSSDEPTEEEEEQIITKKRTKRKEKAVRRMKPEDGRGSDGWKKFALGSRKISRRTASVEVVNEKLDSSKSATESSARDPPSSTEASPSVELSMLKDHRQLRANAPQQKNDPAQPPIPTIQYSDFSPIPLNDSGESFTLKESADSLSASSSSISVDTEDQKSSSLVKRHLSNEAIRETLLASGSSDEAGVTLQTTTYASNEIKTIKRKSSTKRPVKYDSKQETKRKAPRKAEKRGKSTKEMLSVRETTVIEGATATQTTATATTKANTSAESEEPYRIELGDITLSENFIFYSLVFLLVVFIVFSNTVHELGAALSLWRLPE